MAERCDYLQSSRDVVRVDVINRQAGEEISQQCLRHKGHDGPHLIQRIPRYGGVPVLWEEDVCPWGECEFCDNEDPTDNCFMFREITIEEAKAYMKDPTKHMD